MTNRGVDNQTLPESGTTDERPSGAWIGKRYFDETLGVLMVYNGTSWEAVGAANAVKSMPAPQTATDTATLTAAQMLGGVLVATPTAAAAYTTLTGALLDAALDGLLAVDEAIDLVIINLGGTGDDITLTAPASGLTIVGDPVVGPVADVATEQMSTGTFRIRKTAADTFVAYRIA